MMKRNAFDGESLCLFFGAAAELACDSVSSKAPTCLRCVKHHFRGSMLVFEVGHIYFFFYKMFYVLKGCAQRKFEGTASIALNLTEAGQRNLSTFD